MMFLCATESRLRPSTVGSWSEEASTISEGNEWGIGMSVVDFGKFYGEGQASLRHSHTPLRVIVANSPRSGSGTLGLFNLSTTDIPLPIPSIPVFTVFTDGPEPAFSANVDALLSTTERARRIAWIAHVESFLGDLVSHVFYCVPANYVGVMHNGSLLNLLKRKFLRLLKRIFPIGTALTLTTTSTPARIPLPESVAGPSIISSESSVTSVRSIPPPLPGPSPIRSPDTLSTTSLLTGFPFCAIHIDAIEALRLAVDLLERVRLALTGNCSSRAQGLMVVAEGAAEGG
ncbi:hypothetical protein BGY98DRAFT_1159606 [Russula aff. rugulosa BPL654]|nr:hypothetical protein BGY98DRAFT_1159606 [Russula aff. rugulosa BPL654]